MKQISKQLTKSTSNKDFKSKSNVSVEQNKEEIKIN